MSLWRSALTTVSFVAFLFVTPLAPLHAQEDSDPLATAIAAYNDLDFDTAAIRLREALGLSGPQRLSETHRARALMYLGAAELFRDGRPAAVEAFQSLLLAQPRYRPDAVIFPPEVMALYQETRIGVRAIEAVVAPLTDLAVPVERLPVMLYASSLHEIRVRITTSLGAPERILYEGVIGDSLQIAWDGREPSGRVGSQGRYLLRIASRGPGGNIEREVQIPLELEHLPLDTLPWPEPLRNADLLPETEVRANGMRQFLTGLAGAAAVGALPALVGATDAGSVRFVVAGTIAGAGIVGLATAAKPRPIEANVAANAARRAEWQRELQRVQAENTERRRVVRVRVRAERAVTVEIRR